MKYSIPAIICEAEILAQITTIQALGKFNIPIIAISNDRGAVGLTSKYPVRKVVPPMPCHDRSFIDFLLENIEPGVVFYGSDSNAELISKNKSMLKERGFVSHISDPSVQVGLYDKYEMYNNAKNVEIKCPRSILINNENELDSIVKQMPLPFILKPTKGAGGLYYLINNQSADLRQKYKELKEIISSDEYGHLNSRIIAQEFINIRKQQLWNYNALYANGKPIAEFTGLRERTPVKPDGCLKSSLLYGVSKINTELNELNQRLLKYMKYDGLVETEWSLDMARGGYVLFDVNARPSGNIRWAIAGGVNLPYIYYRLCLGKMPRVKVIQKNNVTYHKIFWFNIDLLDAIRGRLKKGDTKVSVIKSNFFAFLTTKNRAIDVLDFKDLRPTFFILRRLFVLACRFITRNYSNR